jgi:hypothetical protein
MPPSTSQIARNARSGQNSLITNSGRKPNSATIGLNRSLIPSTELPTDQHLLYSLIMSRPLGLLVTSRRSGTLIWGSTTDICPKGGKPSSTRMDRKHLVILATKYSSNAFTQAFRHNRVGASGSDVVDYSAQKDDIPVDRTSVDASLVCVVYDIEVVENLVDVLSHRAPASGCPCKALSAGSTNERSASFV